MTPEARVPTLALSRGFSSSTSEKSDDDDMNIGRSDNNSDNSPGLTHVDGAGRARMVGVGHKTQTRRIARASGTIILGPEAFTRVAENSLKKGDVLTVAQIAGVLGAKQTPALIPLCHPLQLDDIKVDLSLDHTLLAVRVEAEVEVTGKTGVEMEALTAVSVALLTVYDMAKAVSKDMVITDIKLQFKTGGKSDYGDKVIK